MVQLRERITESASDGDVEQRVDTEQSSLDLATENLDRDLSKLEQSMMADMVTEAQSLHTLLQYQFGYAREKVTKGHPYSQGLMRRMQMLSELISTANRLPSTERGYNGAKDLLAIARKVSEDVRVAEETRAKVDTVLARINANFGEAPTPSVVEGPVFDRDDAPTEESNPDDVATDPLEDAPTEPLVDDAPTEPLDPPEPESANMDELGHSDTPVENSATRFRPDGTYVSSSPKSPEPARELTSAQLEQRRVAQKQELVATQYRALQLQADEYDKMASSWGSFFRGKRAEYKRRAELARNDMAKYRREYPFLNDEMVAPNLESIDLQVERAAVQQSAQIPELKATMNKRVVGVETGGMLRELNANAPMPNKVEAELLITDGSDAMTRNYESQLADPTVMQWQRSQIAHEAYLHTLNVRNEHNNNKPGLRGRIGWMLEGRRINKRLAKYKQLRGER